MLSITEEQSSDLSKVVLSRTLAAGDVFRARLILALANGQSYSQIVSPVDHGTYDFTLETTD